MGSVGSFLHEIRLSLRHQGQLDPIEAWLKLNAEGPWKMEFQGMAPGEPGAQPRVVVLFRFANEADALRFKQARVERSGGAKLPPNPAAPSVEPPIAAAGATRPPMARGKAGIPSRKHAQAAAPAEKPTADFAKLAADLIRGADEVMAGKVQLIGLERIRERFGDNWSRVAERADRIAEQAIRRRLSSHDIMTKVHDLNYLVLFTGVPQAEAQLRCRMIADDIARELLGDEGSAELLEVKTAVAQVDKVSFEETPSLEALSSLLAAGAGGASPPADAPPPARPRAAWTQPADPLDAVEFVYRPMWDVKRKVVSAFLCLPALRLPGGQRVVGEQSIPGIESEDVQKTLDSRLLDRVLEDLSKVAQAGRRLLLALPVHFNTIAAASRRLEYLNECRRLPPGVAKLLLFEIVGAPSGVPQSRILELATALRTQSRAVLFRTPIWSSGWGELSQAGILAVGADLSRENAPEATLMERFVKFAETADAKRLGCYLHGLRSLSLTVSAVGAGFHYLSGQPIADLADAPPDAHHFSLADLYDATVGTE